MAHVGTEKKETSTTNVAQLAEKGNTLRSPHSPLSNTGFDLHQYVVRVYTTISVMLQSNGQGILSRRCHLAWCPMGALWKPESYGSLAEAGIGRRLHKADNALSIKSDPATSRALDAQTNTSCMKVSSDSQSQPS